MLLDEFSDYLDGYDSEAPNGGNIVDSESDVQERDVVQKIGTLSKVEEKEKDFYERLAKAGINLDELRDIFDCKKSMSVLSCAGSGKTTSLVLNLIKGLHTGEYCKYIDVPTAGGVNRVLVPKRILVSTFLKSGAEDIRKTFYKWCAKLGLSGLGGDSIKFCTLHSEFFNVLKDVGAPIVVSDDASAMLRVILNKYHVKNMRSYSKAITADEMRDCEGIVTYARNRIDDKRYKHPLMSEYNLDETTLKCILLDFQTKRRVLEKNDFEDLQELIYQYAQQNENLANFLATRYDIIMLDEFQDTAQIQYEIMKWYFKGAEKIITFGDDDQTIYSWRGSDVEIITHKFEDDFHPEVKQLSINYRCKRNILNPVIPSIELNTSRHVKTLKAYMDGGELYIREKMDVDELVRDVKEDLARFGSVGVLSRTNFDLIIPAVLLEMDGTIEFELGKSISLTSGAPKDILGVMNILLKRCTPEFESYFSMFLSRYNGYQATNLTNVLKSDKELSIFNIPKRDLEYSVPDLAKLILALREIREKNGDVAAYRYILGVLRNEVYTGKSTYAQKAREFTSFVDNIIATSDVCKGMTLTGLNEMFNVDLPERLRKRTGVSKTAKVKISTVHDAKGKQWDSVYAWNDIDGVFPAYVGDRELSLEEYEEERRVHYIMWTRAKEKLTVFTSMEQKSPFLKECSVPESCFSLKPNEVIPVKTTVCNVRVNTYEEYAKETANIIRDWLDDTQSKEYDKISTCFYTLPLDKLLERIVNDVTLRIGNVSNGIAKADLLPLVKMSLDSVYEEVLSEQQED